MINHSLRTSEIAVHQEKIFIVPSVNFNLSVLLTKPKLLIVIAFLKPWPKDGCQLNTFKNVSEYFKITSIIIPVYDIHCSSQLKKVWMEIRGIREKVTHIANKGGGGA